MAGGEAGLSSSQLGFVGGASRCGDTYHHHYHARPGGRLTQRHRIPHAPVDTSRSVVRSIAVVTASFANPPPHRARRGRLDVRDALVRLCGPSAVLMARGAATRRRRMADRTRATGCDSEERMPLICPANLSL